MLMIKASSEIMAEIGDVARVCRIGVLELRITCLRYWILAHGDHGWCIQGSYI